MLLMMAVIHLYKNDKDIMLSENKKIKKKQMKSKKGSKLNDNSKHHI